MKKIGALEFLWTVSSMVLFFVGAWQFDLLAAPAFWHTEYFVETLEEPFLLPFNVPLDKQHAYVLFFGFMEIAFLLAILSPGRLRVFITKVKRLKKR